MKQTQQQKKDQKRIQATIPSQTLLISNVNKTTTEKTLMEYFQIYGTIKFIDLQKQPDNNNLKICFISYEEIN